MLGESRKVARASGAEGPGATGLKEAREFNPLLDLIAPAFGLIALVAESVTLGGQRYRALIDSLSVQHS